MQEEWAAVLREVNGVHGLGAVRGLGAPLVFSTVSGRHVICGGSARARRP